MYPGVVEKLSAMNLSTIRFPGGSLSLNYHWWDGIGPKASRPNATNYFTGQPTTNNYGMDEHFDLCQSIGAIPTIITNFQTGTILEAANWVEYCNGEIPSAGVSENWTVSNWTGNESAPSGYFAWLRGEYGHDTPYNITNWEIGNEVYDNWTKSYNATEYATSFINYSYEMKLIDPTIKIAAVGYEVATGIWNESLRDTVPWNQEVARVAGHCMDAINIHQYAPVSENGQTLFFFGNGTYLKYIIIPQAGNYQIFITARGLNNILAGTYPSSPNNYANMSINIDDRERNKSII